MLVCIEMQEAFLKALEQYPEEQEKLDLQTEDMFNHHIRPVVDDCYFFLKSEKRLILAHSIARYTVIAYSQPSLFATTPAPMDGAHPSNHDLERGPNLFDLLCARCFLCARSSLQGQDARKLSITFRRKVLRYPYGRMMARTTQ